jgi:hypothetical protein
LKKLFWFIPLVLILISIIFSILSFNLSTQIKKGYHLLNETEISPYYSGNYDFLFGNVDEKIQYYKVINQTNSLTLQFYDNDKNLLESVELTIENFNPLLEHSSFTYNLSTNFIDASLINENTFSVSLVNGSAYKFTAIYSINNSSIEDLDYAILYLDESTQYKQSIYSNVMITSFIFTLISVGTLGGYHFVKK